MNWFDPKRKTCSAKIQPSSTPYEVITTFLRFEFLDVNGMDPSFTYTSP
jgi:hypothetical protein